MLGVGQATALSGGISEALITTIVGLSIGIPAVVVEQKDYVLFVDKQGKMFLDDKEVVMADLEAKMKDALPEMKDSALVLKADQDVSHGIVVKIMDIVKKSGVKKLIIGTKLQE